MTMQTFFEIRIYIIMDNRNLEFYINRKNNNNNNNKSFMI